MLTVLQFILSDWKIFIGTVIIIFAIGQALNAVLVGIRGKKSDLF